MKWIEKLFEIENAFCNEKECNDIFFYAMKEAFFFHYENNEVYKKICDMENFNFNSIGEVDELYKIPHIIVDAFKWYDFLSIDKSQVVSTFTSSGTSGQKSHISWDAKSKERQSLMREKIMASNGYISDKKVNYLMFSYSPEASGGKGAAYAHRMYSGFAPENEKFFAIDADQNGMPKFFLDKVIEKLKDFSEQGLPLRVIGFPAFIYETLLEMERLNLKFDFGEESLIIIGGGWKTAQNRSIPFEQFAELTKKYLGIDGSRIVDIYGFVEHGVPYMTCKNHHFHIPIFSKVFIRKPGTLEVLREGEKGLIHVLTPYNYAQPTISVLATDYGVLHSNCTCGITRQYLELKGRAGMKKHKGCAISASELLKANGR